MDFAITSETAKAQRMKEIENYVALCGAGTLGLTEANKHSRIEKILRLEAEKLKGFGKDKNSGVELFTKAKSITVVNTDKLPDEVKQHLSEYPDDPYEITKTGTKKILNIEVHNDGSMEMDGIILDGTENDVRTRKTFGVMSMGDKALAQLEKQQYKKGILKEVSDRTMNIHMADGLLTELLEAPNIDTNKDKEFQY